MTVPVASFTVSATSGMMPFQVQFTDTSTGTPTAWLWDFGDGYASNRQNPIHTYNTPGSFIVKLTVTNTSGYSAYSLPQPIGISLPDFDLVLQVAGKEQRGAYLIGSFKASPKLGAKGTCGFSLFNPTIRPVFGHEVGIWDGNEVDEVRKHGAVISASNSNFIATDTFTCGSSGTVRVVFSTSTVNGTRQGIINFAGGVRIYIDGDNVLYVQFSNSDYGDRGIVWTGITPVAGTQYDVTARWSNVTGQWGVRVNKSTVKSGTASFTTASGRIGVSQYGNDPVSASYPLLGQIVQAEVMSDVLTDLEVQHLESWIPFPYNDPRYVAAWDFHQTGDGIPSTGHSHYLYLAGTHTWSSVNVTMARKLFGGRVQSVEETDKNLAPNMWYNITCDDWSSILRRYIVNVTYSNFTPLSVIQDACATLAIDGLTMEHVSTSDSAMTTSFASKTYSIKSYDDVIADVLKLVNRAYFVDAYRDIHVYSTGTVNCPISLTDDSNNYRNLKVRRDGSCYANTEFLTTGTLSVKGGSASSPWYIQNINNTLEYGYNSDMINAQKSVENGGWGQYDFAQNDNTITDEHVAISRIEADLTKYGQIAETLQFDTDCAGIEVGQVLSAVLSAHNVSGQYLLTTVSIQDKSGMLLRKTVTAIKGVYQFQWIDFFKSLGKQGA